MMDALNPTAAHEQAEQISIRSPLRPPAYTYLLPRALHRDLWSHRHLIEDLTLRDLQLRFRGSWLGIFWTLLKPLVLLVIYTFVFGVVFRAHWGPLPGESRFEFAVALFCGLVIYGVFAECASAAPSLILRQRQFVKRVVFPLQILPIVSLGSVLAASAFSFVILVLGVAMLRGGLPVTLVWLPLILLAISHIALAVGWLCAAGGVFLRDLEQAVAVVVTLLYFATPIFYPLSAVPEPYRQILLLNPLTLIVESARDAVVWGRTPPVAELCALVLSTAVLALLSYVVFMKVRRGFADVL